MKSTAFVDRRCPVCDGKGRTRKSECVRCKGTGMVGSLEEVEVRMGEPDAFARMFRAARERVGASMREVAPEIGVSVSRLSDLERGVGAPRTGVEQAKMAEWWMNCKPEVWTVVGYPGVYIVKRQEQEPLQSVIHAAKCCVNCTYHSDATITTGHCEKRSVNIKNNQVCDYFIERY